MGTQTRLLFGDEADAHAYWATREWKTYAVDLIAGSGPKRKVIHTMYVRARDEDGARMCARENDVPGLRNPPTCRGWPAPVSLAARHRKAERLSDVPS